MFLLVLYTLIALIFSFICSIAEAVLLSVTPAFISSLEKTDPRTATVLRRLKDNVDRPLAAILSLNTIAHTIGAAGAGAQAAMIFGNAYIGLASAVLTLLILIFSEIIPKTLGAVYWRQLAPFVAPTIRLLIWVLYPLVVLSEKITILIAKGQKPHVFSREEFMALATLGQKHGHLDDRELHIVKNLLRFRDLRASDVMTPRTVALAIEEDQTVGNLLAAHKRLIFSRIPVYSQNRDNITGFVLKTDILMARARHEDHRRIRELRRDLHAVPHMAPLYQVFESFISRRDHIHLVVDEFGGFAGIVTLEDVVETLLGLEIVDEGDPAVDMRALAREKWKHRAAELGLIPIGQES